MRMIFVNLPVKSVTASRRFFVALGYVFNEQFSDENTACMVRLLDDLVSVHAELVVVVGSAGLCGSKTVPDLKAFDSPD